MANNRLQLPVTPEIPSASSAGDEPEDGLGKKPTTTERHAEAMIVLENIRNAIPLFINCGD